MKISNYLFELVYCYLQIQQRCISFSFKQKRSTSFGINIYSKFNFIWRQVWPRVSWLPLTFSKFIDLIVFSMFLVTLPMFFITWKSKQLLDWRTMKHEFGTVSMKFEKKHVQYSLLSLLTKPVLLAILRMNSHFKINLRFSLKLLFEPLTVLRQFSTPFAKSWALGSCAWWHSQREFWHSKGTKKGGSSMKNTALLSLHAFLMFLHVTK